MAQFEEETLFVFPTHEEKWIQNKSKLLQLNASHPIAKINAVSKGIHSQSSSADKSGVLNWHLKSNARYLSKPMK